MTLLELRTVDADLLPAIVELDQLCFGGLWTLEGYQREVDSPNSELLALVPKDGEIGRWGDGEKPETQMFDPPIPLSPYPPILGYACFWSILDEAHITIIAVHPDYQHQGFGQFLLCALLDRAHQRGMKHATLEVRISNQSAISLYEKFQFKVAGRRKRYYTDTGEDALILWRGELQTGQFLTFLKTLWNSILDRLKQQQWTLKISPLLLSIEKSTLTC